MPRCQTAAPIRSGPHSSFQYQVKAYATLLDSYFCKGPSLCPYRYTRTSGRGRGASGGGRGRGRGRAVAQLRAAEALRAAVAPRAAVAQLRAAEAGSGGAAL